MAHATITTLVSDLLQKLDEDAAAASGRHMDTERRRRRAERDTREWFSVAPPPPPHDPDSDGGGSGSGSGDNSDGDGSGADEDRERKYGPPATASAATGGSSGDDGEDEDEEDAKHGDAGTAWRAVSTIKPWEAIELYLNRMRALTKVTSRDLSHELREAESYMLSHAHRHPMEDEASTLALLDFVWLYLCHVYVKHSALHERVVYITNAIAQHNATATANSATSRSVVESELRRRILKFHRGGRVDYLSYVHTAYIRGEETRRSEYSRNESAQLRGERLGPAPAAAASSSAAGAAAGATSRRNPDTLRFPDAPKEPGADAVTPGSLRHVLRMELTERDFMIACAIELLRDEKLGASTNEKGAVVRPSDLTMLKWSAQYAWSVLFKETFLALHIRVDPQPAALTHWRPYFRARLLLECQHDIKDSWKEYREFMMRLWAPAGFAIRSGRLELTKRNESLAARVMNDIKLLLDNVTYPHVNENLKTLLEVRLSTKAKQYCRTDGHPGQDAFVFFYFTLLFKRDTNCDFMERYVLVGDCGASDPLATWRYVARRPRKLSASPHLPLIVEYGGKIRVRMGNRVYSCDTLVDAASTWCVLVRMYFSHDSGSRKECRLTEEGVDINPFLSKFLTNVRLNSDAADTRGHVLAELAPDVYPYGVSDTEDDMAVAEAHLAILERINGAAAAAAPAGDPEALGQARPPAFVDDDDLKMLSRIGGIYGSGAAFATPAGIQFQEKEQDRAPSVRPSVPRPPPPGVVIGVKRERSEESDHGDYKHANKVPRPNPAAAHPEPLPPPPLSIPTELRPARFDDGQYDPEFGANPPAPQPDVGEEDEGDGGRARRERDRLWNAQRRHEQQRRLRALALAAPGADAADAADEAASRLARISAERRAQRFERREAVRRSTLDNSGGARRRARSASAARAALLVSRQRELDSP